MNLNDYNSRYERSQTDFYNNNYSGNSRRSPNTISTTANEFRELKSLSSKFEKDARLSPVDQAVAGMVTRWTEPQLKASRKEHKKKLLIDVEGLLKTSKDLLENFTGANKQLRTTIETFSYEASNDLETWFSEVSEKWAKQRDALIKAVAAQNDGINSRIARLEEKGREYEEYKKAEPANGPMKFLLRPLKISEDNFLLLKNHTEMKHNKNQEELKKLQEARKVLDELLKNIEEMEASNNILGNLAPKMINLHKSNQKLGEEVQKYKSALPTLKNMSAKEIRTVYINPAIEISKAVSSNAIDIQKEILKAFEKFRSAQGQTAAAANQQSGDLDFDDDIKTPIKHNEIHDELLAKKWTELLLSVHLNKKELDLMVISYRLVPTLSSYLEELMHLIETEGTTRKGVRERTRHEASYSTTKRRFDEMFTNITTAGDEKSTLVECFEACKTKLGKKGKIDVMCTSLEPTRSPFFQPDVALSNHKSHIEKTETLLDNEVTTLWKSCTSKAEELILELEMRCWVLRETKPQANDQNLDMTKNKYPLKTGLLDAHTTGFYALHKHQTHEVGTQTLANPFTFRGEQSVEASRSSPEGSPPSTLYSAFFDEKK